MTSKILFLHGWHSSPGGVKPAFLRDQGYEVLNPKLDDDDFEAAVAAAQAEFDGHRPQVIVGSSRGGAVALNVRSEDTPLVLMCPGWKRWGTVKTLKANSLILHSRQDDVVPFSFSEELVSESGLPPETLIEVGHDHWLSDEATLSVLVWACRLLESGKPLPWMEDKPDNPTTSFGDSTANIPPFRV